MFKFAAAIFTILISGCATFVEHNSRHTNPNRSMVIEIKELRSTDINVLGEATIYGNKCVVALRNYPKCLAHEIRHCYEGNWHEGRNSDEDCYH